MGHAMSEIAQGKLTVPRATPRRRATLAELEAALDRFGYKLTAGERAAVREVSYSGWTWTTRNFERMFTSSDSLRVLINTAFYVAAVLFLFNIPYALVLAIGTHYMPPAPSVLIQDADGHADRHWRPGKGTINWVAVFEALRDSGANPPHHRARHP